MKVCISNLGRWHSDYAIALEAMKEVKDVQVVNSIEECEIYFCLAGMYLTYGYKEKIEEELKKAMEADKIIYVVAPHGSNYIPKYFRDKKLKHIALQKNKFISLLQQI